MKNKNHLILLIFSLFTIWVVHDLLAGGVNLLLIFGAIAVLFIVKLAKPWWVGLILGLLTLSVSLPYPILEKIPLGILIIIIIIFVLFEEGIFNKRDFNLNIYKSKSSLFMLFTAVIILLRYLYDRPFSAALGTRGGGAQAFFYAVGAIAYFSILKITTKKFDIKSNLNILIIVLVVSASIDWITHRVLDYDSSGGIIALFRGVFWGPFWFLPPLVLAMLLYKQQKNITPKPKPSYNILIFLVMLITLFLAFTAPFRSRPYFAIAMIFSVYFVFHKTKTLLPMLVGSAALVLVVLLSINDSQIQSNLLRTLSTVYRFDESYFAANEMGWTSGFRGNLLEDAMMEIKNNPLLGRGLSFSRSELMSTFVVGQKSDSNVQALMLSGVYHNSVIALAVNCGIPAALFFCVAFVLTLINFIRYMRQIDHNQIHLLGAGVLGFFSAFSGSMLMNGGGTDFIIVCSLMGFMNGLCLRGKDIDNGSKSFGQSRVAI